MRHLRQAEDKPSLIWSALFELDLASRFLKLSVSPDKGLRSMLWEKPATIVSQAKEVDLVI